MKFNPITQRLFTDDRCLIKRLHCPFKVDWRKLEPTPKDATARACDRCHHSITRKGVA